MNVCIVGGGPAGMMLGFLLARAGIEVDVLEKHKDFLRDFRGDTVHPSTSQLMDELGLLDDFLARPHQVVKQIGGQIGDETVIMADFTHLPVKCPYIALMPQVGFPRFHCRTRASAAGLPSPLGNGGDGPDRGGEPRCRRPGDNAAGGGRIPRRARRPRRTDARPCCARARGSR